jgi:NAD(P)-dependent dehydrogenase (short-subunit alcohol dehydrogenase family)
MQFPIRQQVVVITGASSGIGRETALAFARKGARVVLAARNEAALRNVAEEIKRIGGAAHVVATDVADPAQVDRLAQEAVNAFGRIDTWVNDAAVSEYATFEQMTDEEFRRIVDVNLMGPVYGTRAALRHMKGQGGGTIINIGSVLSDRAVPLQSAYVATKHALRGFTDAVRMELQRERSGVNVTLILPASINTPLFDHARSRMSRAPKPIPPIYEPSVVSSAILYAAEHKVREIYAGGFGKFLSLMNKISPRLVDWYMMKNDRMFVQQIDAQKPNDGRDTLHVPAGANGAARGRFGDQASSSSPYTRWIDPHPAVKGALIGAFAIGAAAALIGLGRATKATLSNRAVGRGVPRGGLFESAREFVTRPRGQRIVVEDPRDILARNSYVPVVKALVEAGIEPRTIPGFERLHNKFLRRLDTAAAIAAGRYEAEAERSGPARREPLGHRIRRLGSRLAESYRSA